MTSPGVIVVSGLPRSGTSLMMQILHAGGMPVLADDSRPPDIDNPRGYFELEAVKRLPHGDTTWLEHARGRAVKVVAPLLVHLPASYRYRVVFMRRSLDAVLASQAAMLERRGRLASNRSQATLSESYRQQLDTIDDELAARPEMDALYVNYEKLVQSPAESVARVATFLEYALDQAAAVAVVDPSLARQVSAVHQTEGTADQPQCPRSNGAGDSPTR